MSALNHTFCIDCVVQGKHWAGGEKALSPDMAKGVTDLNHWWSDAEQRFADIDMFLQELSLRAAISTYNSTGANVDEVIKCLLVSFGTARASLMLMPWKLPHVGKGGS